MTVKLIIFDWDGTVSDSVARISTCIQLAAKDHDLPVPDFNAAKEIIGLGLQEAIAQLFPQAPTEMVTAFSETYSAHYRTQDHKPCDFFPGVMDTLEQLRDQNYLLAIATGKSRAGLDRVLHATALQDFFHSSRCADETRSKPHPLMLQELLALHNVAPEQAIMVGDTEFDMEMAGNAGGPRIGVSYGAHEAERLDAFNIIACLDRFSDIHNHL
ncbi:HAD-IA family hydrolase [Porticoccaceae bacterium]|nr:HAD-IA family hydrolase [Porticoccaceae bacterium]